MVPSTGSEGESLRASILASGGCWQSLVFLGLGCMTDLCLYLHMAFPLVTLCLKSPLSSLIKKDTAHWMTLILIFLKAETLLLSKVTFTDIGIRTWTYRQAYPGDYSSRPLQ